MADHLVLVPTVVVKTQGEAADVGSDECGGGVDDSAVEGGDSRARDFIGVGGFNLIRREVYQRLGGFEALRMEVLDDLRLGWLVKRGGYRQRVAVGPGLVYIRWLPGALGVVHLVEKNGFAAFRFRVGLSRLAGLGLLVQAVLPLLAIAAGGWALAAGLLTYLARSHWRIRPIAG